MLILGIETSCDETAASLLEVENGKVAVLSNVISSQIKLHAKYGGVVPSLAAREHVKNLPRVLKMSFKAGKCSMEDIDLLAVTRGPGLVSSLLVGTAFAQALAWKYKKPLIGVNHLEGHIASNWLPPIAGNQKLLLKNKIVFPALCLIVSGGHTELVLMKKNDDYKLIGQTLDDAAGEAFDKIARILELGYPGGPIISAVAEKIQNSIDKYQIKLPRPMINSKNLDFSFAGLKTAVLYLVRDLTNRYSLSQIRPAVAAETQQAIVDVLIAKTTRAAEKYKAKSIMLCGGVSANISLRSSLAKTAKQMRLKFLKPEMEYTTDNAAMIALAGYFGYHKKKNPPSKKRGAKTVWETITVEANLGF